MDAEQYSCMPSPGVNSFVATASPALYTYTAPGSALHVKYTYTPSCRADTKGALFTSPRSAVTDASTRMADTSTTESVP